MRVARASFVAMCLALAAACGGGGKDAAVCRREAAELGELLSSMDHELPPFYAGGLVLVTRTDVPKTANARGPTITITKDGATLDGQPLDMVRGQLVAAQTYGTARAGRTDDAELVYVVVDEEAPWSDVAPILEIAHEVGFRRPALAFTRPPDPVTRPPRSKIDDELDRIQHGEEAGNKATELARLVEKLVKGCPAIQEAFGAVAAADGESKAETIIRAIEPSLVKCNCNVDMAAFRSVMFRLLYIEKPQSSFRITLDPAAPAITLPASTPWRLAHDRFSPEARVWVSAP